MGTTLLLQRLFSGAQGTFGQLYGAAGGADGGIAAAQQPAEPQLHSWSATLTRRGMDVVAYAASCESGIPRPKKYWHEKNGSAKQSAPAFTALHKALQNTSQKCM